MIRADAITALTTLARERRQAPQISFRPESLVERARREELLRSPAVPANDTGCEVGEYDECDESR